MLLSGCRVQHHTHSATVANHATARTERDSIFVHDSIVMDYRRGRILPATELLSSLSPAEIAALSKITSCADVVMGKRSPMTSIVVENRGMMTDVVENRSSITGTIVREWNPMTGVVPSSILPSGTDVVPDVYDADICDMYAVHRFLPCIRSPDTVYLERWHTAYKDRLVHHTDTMQVVTTQTQTVQVPYIPKFYKYCTALSALLLFFFLLQVLLYLRRRFH